MQKGGEKSRSFSSPRFANSIYNQLATTKKRCLELNLQVAGG
jgi:hypothetical protein